MRPHLIALAEVVFAALCLLGAIWFIANDAPFEASLRVPAQAVRP